MPMIAQTRSHHRSNLLDLALIRDAKALVPVDGIFAAVKIDHVKPGKHFFGLGKGTIE